ncbi:MAG TPA: ABC transporter ATP-binding protein, partial [Thermomicrobiales bacterium]|nr:ABC transporter ATP-binding protein [Thermomicrobiales bacterium]
LFDLGALFADRFRLLRDQLRRERLALATRRSLADLVTQAGATLAIFGAYIFVAHETIQGVITLGALVMYFQALQRGQTYLQELLQSLAGLYEDNLFLTSFYEFLAVDRTLVDPTRPRPAPRTLRAGLAFDRVSFRYAAGSRLVLDDITLAVRPGEVVALVGENGSGKTTLVKLLCRLYDPTDGAITYEGIDLRRFRPADYRRQISVVFQDYAHYHLTARENIWHGDIASPAEAERIEAAARRAGVHGVLRDLPRGYDTILGKVFEEGEELSIGEWQKVALARAFLRDAPVIVLDEPTSALDPTAEAEAHEKFRHLVAGRAAILISHRLSTVTMADRIYVLERGRIVEQGTHDELLCRGGTYARMFEAQARQYRSLVP